MNKEICPLCMKLENVEFGICFNCFKCEMKRQGEEHKRTIEDVQGVTQ